VQDYHGLTAATCEVPKSRGVLNNRWLTEPAREAVSSVREGVRHVASCMHWSQGRPSLGGSQSFCIAAPERIHNAALRRFVSRFYRLWRKRNWKGMPVLCFDVKDQHFLMKAEEDREKSFLCTCGLRDCVGSFEHFLWVNLSAPSP
jgi:hypothetical protein